MCCFSARRGWIGSSGIMQRLSSLGSQFGQHLLDATQAWIKHVTDEAALTGLPDGVKNLAKQYAAQRDLAGWVLTLDMPCFLPVMSLTKPVVSPRLMAG